MIETKLKPQAFLRIEQVLQRVPVSAATLYRWINAGTFPAPKQIGEVATAWLESDVEHWIVTKAQGGEPRPRSLPRRKLEIITK